MPRLKGGVSLDGMIFRAALVGSLVALTGALAQTPPTSPEQIDALSKKIDEINIKLDALSQEMLKIEQKIGRPGVMIGESSPAATSAAAAPLHPSPSGNTHVVTRGETLTSIAKMYKVSVDELQKFNHIEDGRKLQAGQSLMIPTSVPSPSPSPSPTE